MLCDIVLTGRTEEERQNQLNDIRGSLGDDEAAEQLAIEARTNEDGDMEYAVAINGDVDEFRSRSETAETLASLIESDIVIEFAYGRNRKSDGAGLTEPLWGGDWLVTIDRQHPSSSRRSPRVGPLPGDELAMPAQDRVGRDQRANFGEHTTTDSFAVNSKSATLVVVQSEPPATQLLPEDSVLLAEIVDDSVFMASDPASERRDENLPRLEDGRHPLIVSMQLSNRQLSLAG